MPVEVIMPKVDMDMTEGTFAVWHVAEGTEVAKGAPLFDIETDKSAMEVEAPASGRLHHIIAQPGERIAVGAPVAWLYAAGETVGARPDAATSPVTEMAATEPAPALQTAPAPAPAPASLASTVRPASLVAPVTAPRATPAARRLARTEDLAIATLTGTGPRGRIQRADVELAVLARAAPPAPGPIQPPARVPEPAPARAAVWSSEGDGLHVSRRMGTGTPLVLIHGFAADSMGWAQLERELPGHLPLIRIDLPSHGKSPRSRVGSFQDLLRAVTGAFDNACDGPVHLLGHSLGGAVALGLADIRPRQMTSLTLLAPTGLGPEIDAAALLGIARASRTESLAPWLQRLTATPDAISWDFARAAMLSRTDPDLRAAQLELADMLFPDGVQGFDLRAALARVEAPTALVWGRDDHILPWRHALSAKGEMALHLMPNVGHIPHVERPAELARIIARHLGRAA